MLHCLGGKTEEVPLCRVGPCGHGVKFIKHDVADADAHVGFIDRCWDVYGSIDTLVNNAGVQVKHRGDLLDMRPDEFDRLLSTNLRGPYFLSIAFAKKALQHPPGGFHRSIINIGSVSSAMASTNRGPYCVSKAGITMMSQLFAARLAAHEITVNEIRPEISAPKSYRRKWPPCMINR